MAELKVKVGVDKSGLTTGLASMENSVKGFGTKIGGILAGAFAFDKIIQGFSNAIDKGDQLQDLANRFGVAASSLQEIGNAASTSGAGLEDVASAMNKLAKNAGAAIGAFNKIGLSVEQLQGMTPQDLFMALSKAVASGTLGMQDFTIAQELAGKGAAVLMETLRMGPEVIQANGQAMGVFSNETIAQLSAASDALKAFQNVVTIVFGTAVSKIMDAVEAYARFAAIRPLIQFFDQIKSSTTGSGKSIRDMEGGSGGAAASADKTFEASERAAARHELRLIEAQIAGKEEAEKMKQEIEEKYAQKSLERAQRLEEQKADQMDDRKERLAQINKQRGNAPDFDPREALMQRFGLGGQLRDIPTSTEAQRTQPVRLENPPSLQGVLDKLDTLIKNAGVFS
ncbi:MAG: hypothetical protein EBU06_05640 [Micrococcales bacterium]|nr:hypothetical protein [Micrococcales bacterium]